MEQGPALEGLDLPAPFQAYDPFQGLGVQAHPDRRVGPEVGGGEAGDGQEEEDQEGVHGLILTKDPARSILAGVRSSFIFHYHLGGPAMSARSNRPSESGLRFPELGRGWIGVLLVAAGLGAAGLAPDDPSSPGLAQFSFLPPKGPAGIRVVLEGEALDTPKVVRFGVLPAAFKVVSPGRIETHVPEGAGTGPITLVSESGRTYTSGAPFQVLPGRGKPPAITSFWPGSGPAGTELSLTGASLEAVEEVRVGGRVAEFTTLTDTDLTVYIPPDQAVSGPIAVISPFGTAVSGQPFQVTSPAGL
jgi:hypothetical protein